MERPFKRLKVALADKGRNGGGGGGDDDDDYVPVRKSAEAITASAATAGVAKSTELDAAALQLRKRLLNVLNVHRDRCPWTSLPDLPDVPAKSEAQALVAADDPCSSSGSKTEPTNSASKLEAVTLSDASKLPSSNISVKISHCPMCQIHFFEGLTQIEVDEHIALCLQDSMVEW